MHADVQNHFHLLGLESVPWRPPPTTACTLTSLDTKIFTKHNCFLGETPVGSLLVFTSSFTITTGLFLASVISSLGIKECFTCHIIFHQPQPNSTPLLRPWHISASACLSAGAFSVTWLTRVILSIAACPPIWLAVGRGSGLFDINGNTWISSAEVSVDLGALWYTRKWSCKCGCSTSASPKWVTGNFLHYVQH